MTTNKELLKELEDECRAHDWYYNYSDDHRVWLRGRDQYKKVNAILKKLNNSRNAIEVYNRYAPDKYKL